MAVAGGGGGVVSRPAPLAPEAAAVVARWRPVRWPDDDAAAVVPLLGLVRGWVTVAAPRDARTARRFMRLDRGAGGLGAADARDDGRVDGVGVGERRVLGDGGAR